MGRRPSPTLRWLEPTKNHRWVSRPRGVPIRHHFDIEGRIRPVHHSADLLTWAEQLFAAGLVHHKPRCRRALIRDAALISVLVLPAPRLGALAQLQLGRNLQHHGDGWCIDQNAGITKKKAAEWAPVHPAASKIIERYLAVERIELLNGRMTEHLWIAQGGGDLSEAGITSRLRKLSGQSFDNVFRAHAFRRSLGTTVAVDGFDSPLDGTVLLGHTNASTTGRYYNLARASAAAERQAKRMAKAVRESEYMSRQQLL